MEKAVALEDGGIMQDIAAPTPVVGTEGKSVNSRSFSGSDLGLGQWVFRRGWRWVFRHMSCRRRYFSGRSRAEWEMMFNLLDKVLYYTHCTHYAHCTHYTHCT
jgi:hypothetical protein